ncbi:MAG: aldo/keto reductase [Planctomycetota bacterium]
MMTLRHATKQAPAVTVPHRRDFLTASTGAAAAGVAADALGADAPPPTAPPPRTVTLGATGIKTSFLAQGTGVRGSERQSDQTRMGFADFVALIRHCYDRGLRFFDLADLYGTHVYFREALRHFERDQITILTKLWWPYDGPRDNTNAAHRAQVTRSALDRFCDELTTDYLDIVLLHCLTDPGWREKMRPYQEALSEAKSNGQVRVMGVSCHDFGALKAAAESDWVELILARTNPEGVKMDAAPAEVNAVLQAAKDSGKSVVGMKIFGEGKLADDRERCLRYAQSLDYLDAMTIGFHTPAQVDDVLRLLRSTEPPPQQPA